LAGRQQCNAVFEEKLARAVDESALSVAQDVESHQQGAVERVAGCGFEVGGVEEILDAIAKQKLVAEHLLLAIQDRLPGNKTEILFGGAGHGCKT